MLATLIMSLAGGAAAAAPARAFDTSHNGGWYNKEVLKRPAGGKQPHVSCCAQRFVRALLRRAQLTARFCCRQIMMNTYPP